MTTEREVGGGGLRLRERARVSREDREERGPRERGETVASGKENIEEGESYLRWLQQNLNQLLQAKEISEDELLRVWAAEVTYLQGFGVTPELRGYADWQAREQKGAPLDLYESVKPFIIGSTDMSFTDKFTALLRLHPDAGNAEISRQIRSDVIGSLTEKDIDTGIARHYRSRYDKSVATNQTDVPYPQWLIQQGLATPEGRAGVGEGTPERLAGQTTRPESFAFEPAFEEERLGLQGSQIWKNWYEDRFGLEIRRFKGQVEDQTEETWASFLKKQTPQLREEFLQQGAFRRGERPSAQQPRIRTVRF